MDLFVSPTGSGAADGTSTDNAMSAAEMFSGTLAKPGDVIRMLAGRYMGPLKSQLKGNDNARIKVGPHGNGPVIFDAGPPALPDAPPGQSWKAPVSLIDHVAGGYTDYFGLEFMWSYAGRPPAGTLTDKARPTGIDLHAPGLGVIGCLLHDLGTGIGSWEQNSGGNIRGNILFGNGWQDAPEGTGNPPGQNGTGHGIYGQSRHGLTVERNLDWGGYGYGPHFYTDGSEVWDITVRRNIAWSKGGHSAGNHYKSQFFIGGGNGVKNADFDGNIAFLPLEVEGFNYQLWIGSKRNPGGRFINNISIGSKNGWGAENYDNFRVEGNRIVCSQRPARVASLGSASILRNQYFGSQQFRIDGTVVNWDQWKSRLGESGSSYVESMPAANVIEIIELTQSWLAVCVMNFIDADVVEVSPQGWTTGEPWTLRNVSDWFNPIASGSFGGTISIPLTNLKTSLPIGGTTRIPEQKLFNVFVICRESVTVPPVEPPVDPPIDPPIDPPVDPPTTPNPVIWKGLKTTFAEDGAVTTTMA